MDYIIKLEINGGTGRLFFHMTERNNADERDSSTEVKFYLPAGVNPRFDLRRFKRIWARLSNYRR